MLLPSVKYYFSVVNGEYGLRRCSLARSLDSNIWSHSTERFSALAMPSGNGLAISGSSLAGVRTLGPFSRYSQVAEKKGGIRRRSIEEKLVEENWLRPVICTYSSCLNFLNHVAHLCRHLIVSLSSKFEISLTLESIVYRLNLDIKLRLMPQLLHAQSPLFHLAFQLPFTLPSISIHAYFPQLPLRLLRLPLLIWHSLLNLVWVTRANAAGDLLVNSMHAFELATGVVCTAGKRTVVTIKTDHLSACYTLLACLFPEP